MKDAQNGPAAWRAPAARVRIPPGELLERIAILELKSQRLPEIRARARAAEALAELVAARDSMLPAHPDLDRLAESLREAAADRWAVAADLRACEAQEEFGPGFVALARALLSLEARCSALREEVDAAVGARAADAALSAF